MMSQALIFKIHCMLSAICRKELESSMYNNYNNYMYTLNRQHSEQAHIYSCCDVVSLYTDYFTQEQHFSFLTRES